MTDASVYRTLCEKYRVRCAERWPLGWLFDGCWEGGAPEFDGLYVGKDGRYYCSRHTLYRGETVRTCDECLLPESHVGVLHDNGRRTEKHYCCAHAAQAPRYIDWQTSRLAPSLEQPSGHPDTITPWSIFDPIPSSGRRE